MEQGLASAAAFFGIQLDEKSASKISEPESPPHSTLLPLYNLQPLQKKSSAPIKVGSGSSLQFQADNSPIRVGSGASIESRQQYLETRESFQEAMHKRLSAPMIMSSDMSVESQHSSRSPPEDFIDLKDGHLWRAKYCVLEQGILYFYRNPTDAESTEAIEERRQTSNILDYSKSTSKSSVQDLSKSPMPRSNFHHLDSTSSGESNCMWEKRVFLDCVGAVRSAEQEYGDNAFELVAVSDEDVGEHADTLVLRARNQSDMKEWLFQFHRSLAGFLLNIMDVVGSSSRGAYLDIHHPTFSHQPLSMDVSDYRLTFSPRFYADRPISTSLSHGHGRSALHRRKLDNFRSKSGTPISDNGTCSLSSTPETGCSPGSPQMPFALREPSPTNNRSRSPVCTPERAFLLPPRPEQTVPELSGPQSDYPETERPMPSRPNSGRYVPPHLRNKQQQSETGNGGGAKYVPPHLRRQQQQPLQEGTPKRYIPPSMRNGGSTGNSLLSLADRAKITPSPTGQEDSEDQNFISFVEESKNDYLDVVGYQSTPFKRGGCADPQVVNGSVLDPIYIPKKASRVGPVQTEAFGCYGGGNIDENGKMFNGSKSKLRWETGAVSECGIRESNEDSYLIASDLIGCFRSLSEADGSHQECHSSSWTKDEADHKLGLFALFDGHCGDQAARFAAEKLAHFIYNESGRLFSRDMAMSHDEVGLNKEVSSPFNPSRIEQVLLGAITKLDNEFCHLCVEEGRNWDSGATALVALIVNEQLVIANLGDCRGVMCRSVENILAYANDSSWNQLEQDSDMDDSSRARDKLSRPPLGCFWKEVTNVHSPSCNEERVRIETANGWVTTETEIPIGQLRRIDFLDEDVIEILKRCFYDRCEGSEKCSKEGKAAPQRILQISRVCGELAVSRALGDRDFKAAFNSPSPTAITDADNSQWWDCPLFLPYPDLHNRRFHGDLISNTPDVQKLPIGEAGVSEQFLLLACDGLWDVMDVDDAVRVTRDLLFRKKWTAKKAVSDGCSQSIFVSLH